MKPGLGDLLEPAKTIARLVFLLVIVAICYAIFIYGKDFLVSKRLISSNIDNKKEFINTLNFDYKVVDVVDGDTIIIKRLDGEKVEGVEEKMKVRLLGVNAPESVDPRRPVECFGKESSDYVSSLAEGKVAALEFDPTQAKFDEYGRLLAYIFIKNSGVSPNNVMFLNYEVIKNGYAYEYTYNLPYKYQVQFKNLQGVAKANYLGLWSSNTCKGLRSPVAPPPTN